VQPTTAGDLHLRPTADDAIDKGVRPIDWPRDWDGEARPHGTRPDIGADEWAMSTRAHVLAYNRTMSRVHHLDAERREDLIAVLSRELASRSDVLLAWVFGSFLQPDGFRDVDVALWTAAAADRRADLELAVTLSRAIDLPVDVRLANHAPLPVLFHMLKGRPLVVRDEGLLATLIEQTARRYHDQSALVRAATRAAFAA
jgi:hypothetical protein